ncbi:MAG: hypothetical protein Q9182_005801 [Xanthomendoza sp. 2 TL-2023]
MDDFASRSVSEPDPSDSDAASTCLGQSPPDTKPLVIEQWHNGKAPVATRDNTAEKNFVCDVPDCDKAFAKNGDLTRHLNSHKTGPRTYGCLAPRCPRKGMKGFWRLDKLKDHLDRKHPELEVERWYFEYQADRLADGGHGGYRDVTKRDEHVALMRSEGYKPCVEGSSVFERIRF